MTYSKFFFLLAVQITSVFVIGIGFSFITDYMVSIGFFGDSPCNSKYGCGIISKEIEWGSRHYLWFWMSAFLFVLQMVRIVTWINKNGDNLK